MGETLKAMAMARNALVHFSTEAGRPTTTLIHALKQSETSTRPIFDMPPITQRNNTSPIFDLSALETAPSPRHEATSPPHIETDDIEWDAGRTHRPGQAIHAPAKVFAPPLGTPTPPCLGDDDETESESDMDENDAPAVSLSRSKAAKAEAAQDRAPTRYRKLQARHIRRNAPRDAAKQNRDASAQSEGEQMEDGEEEPQQACQLWLLMELVGEFQTPRRKATTT